MELTKKRHVPLVGICSAIAVILLLISGYLFSKTESLGLFVVASLYLAVLVAYKERKKRKSSRWERVLYGIAIGLFLLVVVSINQRDLPLRAQ